MEIKDLKSFKELTIPEASNITGGKGSSKCTGKRSIGKLSNKKVKSIVAAKSK